MNFFYKTGCAASINNNFFFFKYNTYRCKDKENKTIHRSYNIHKVTNETDDNLCKSSYQHSNRQYRNKNIYFPSNPRIIYN